MFKSFLSTICMCREGQWSLPYLDSVLAYDRQQLKIQPAAADFSDRTFCTKAYITRKNITVKTRCTETAALELVQYSSRRKTVYCPRMAMWLRPSGREDHLFICQHLLHYLLEKGASLPRPHPLSFVVTMITAQSTERT
jgi:hypothetical protein